MNASAQSPKQCRLCRFQGLEAVLDLGPQPVAHRFLRTPGTEYRHPLTLDLCPRCGLSQLATPFPRQELTPRFPWVTYVEPEGHLDEFATTLSRLPNLPANATVCGATYKDDSLLARLKRSGFSRSWRPDPAADLGVVDPAAGLETLCALLEPQAARRLAARHGRFDVVVARHVVEHAEQPLLFLSALAELMTPNGYLVLEVPDCAHGFKTGDVTTLWEEHVSYFTPGLLPPLLSQAGFGTEWLHSYPYPMENCVVAIGRRANTREPKTTADAESESARVRAFAADVPQRRRLWTSALASFRRERGPVALLGAGHRGCSFANLLGLQDKIDLVIDDHPDKAGLLLPGVQKPVRDSTALAESRLCLLSVNPDSENKILERHRAWSDAGGVFASIYPSSHLAFPLEATRQ